jgi:hypothetical protein
MPSIRRRSPPWSPPCRHAGEARSDGM